MPNASRFAVKETKVSSYVAGNGLELLINPISKTVTVKAAGKILSEMDMGLFVQAGKMLARLAPETRFVCDVHGPYFKKPGYAQQAGCENCLNESIIAAQNALATSNVESEEDA